MVEKPEERRSESPETPANPAPTPTPEPIPASAEPKPETFLRKASSSDPTDLRTTEARSCASTDILLLIGGMFRPFLQRIVFKRLEPAEIRGREIHSNPIGYGAHGLPIHARGAEAIIFPLALHLNPEVGQRRKLGPQARGRVLAARAAQAGPYFLAVLAVGGTIGIKKPSSPAKEFFMSATGLPSE